MLGRIIVLMVLILVLIGGGIIWFDYLNVIDAKEVMAPLLRLIGRAPRTGGPLDDDMFLNLDAERLAVRLEALDLHEQDMDRQKQDLDTRQAELDQLFQQLEEDRKAVEEMEKSINEALADAENRDRNVEGISRQLTNMPPERAVAIIAAMQDQNAISVIRKTEELAQRDGTESIVPYWMSLLDPQRAAELQRKMVDSP